jgi:flagellin-like protein
MLRVARRGISDVLTSLLLVMTTVSLSTIFFFWSIGYLGQSQSAISVGLSSGNARVQEQFSIEQVRFWGTNNQITVYIRNFGDLPVTVDHVFLNGKLYAPDTTPSITAVTITGRAVQSITITESSLWSSSQNFIIEVASNRGNTFKQGYTAP